MTRTQGACPHDVPLEVGSGKDDSDWRGGVRPKPGQNLVPVFDRHPEVKNHEIRKRIAMAVGEVSVSAQISQGFNSIMKGLEQSHSRQKLADGILEKEMIVVRIIHEQQMTTSCTHAHAHQALSLDCHAGTRESIPAPAHQVLTPDGVHGSGLTYMEGGYWVDLCESH